MGKRQDLEQHSREVLRDYESSNGLLPNETVVFGKYRMEYDPQDDSVSAWLRTDGFWESWLHVAMESLVLPGMYCLDLGANVGYFTLLMANLAGPGGKVVGVEPLPRSFDILHRNIVSNSLAEYVDAYRVAIGDYGEAATVLRYEPRRTGSATRLYNRGDTWVSAVQSLDDLMGFWPKVDFVKVDVEGDEPKVWRGSKDVRRRNPQSRWMIEIARDRDYDADEFIRQMEEERYVLHAVDEDGSLGWFFAKDFEAVWKSYAFGGQYMNVVAVKNDA